RITLRRSSAESDAGWHLKLPSGPETRTEVPVPLTTWSTAELAVPESLREVVLAIVRDRPLMPMAHISATRTVATLYGPDGSVVAGFYDDQVTARADGADEQRWREWELEITSGGGAALLARLTNRLRDAGGLPAGHRSKLERVLALSGPVREAPEAAADPLHRAIAEQVAELLGWDRAVRSDAHDSVHQMRVATRKIRTLLRSAEGSLGITDDEWVLGELRELAGVLGVARDAEVLAERYARELEALPEPNVRGPVRERLVGGAEKRYQSGWRRSLIALSSQRYFRLLDALEALAAAEPAARTGGEEPAHLTIKSAYKLIRKAAKAAYAAAADDTDEDEVLHRLRKRAKELRYHAAAVGATKVADRAKRIQTLLGDHQDSVVSRLHLSKQAALAHAAGEDTFTYGLLYQQEDNLAQRWRDQLEDALRELHKAVRKS
ncbi:MAG: CHAD domain-containing protein, partial [Mycobacterium sp.]